jgi:hypothetical protein
MTCEGVIAKPFLLITVSDHRRSRREQEYEMTDRASSRLKCHPSTRLTPPSRAASFKIANTLTNIDWMVTEEDRATTPMP